MRHPLQVFDARARRWLFVAATTVAVVVFGVLHHVDDSLGTWPTDLPGRWSRQPGILAFEFAGRPENARDILECWSDRQKARAGFSLGLDFLFISAYSTSLALACLYSAEACTRICGRLSGTCHSLGVSLAWCATIAAVLDVIEDCALLVQLFHKPRSPLPEIA